jgi:hypothetical protein
MVSIGMVLDVSIGWMRQGTHKKAGPADNGDRRNRSIITEDAQSFQFFAIEEGRARLQFGHRWTRMQAEMYKIS